MSADYAIQDAGEQILALRGDLNVIPQGGGAQPHYIVEDALRGRYFRVGPREYALLARLDGRTTLADAIARTASVLGRDALAHDDGLVIARWLIQNQLATTPASTSTTRLQSATDKVSIREWRTRVNPLFARVPLIRPDRALAWLAPKVGFVFSGPFFVAWLILCAAGLITALQSSDAFIAEMWRVIQPRTWLGLGVIWLSLKIIHELSHAVACKKYGGTVPRAGVQLILFAPLAYVDVTSSWRFTSKWRRIIVSAAGMYVELAFAAVAMLVWSWTEAGTLHQAAHHVVLLASVGTLLFNANPLMRFDGYFLLSDWLEIPNLYASGNQYVGHLFQRYVLGRDSRLPDWPAAARRWIKGYGVAAYAWRLFVMIVLTLALIGWWRYAGAILAGMLWVSAIIVPLVRQLCLPIPRQSWRRPAATALAAAAVVIAATLFLARPGSVSAWGVVEYGPLHIVRAGSPGFVRAIYVRDGDVVQTGQVIALLENDELRSQLTDVEIAIRQSRLRQQQHLGNHEYAQLDVEIAKQQALEKRQAELQQQVAALTVRSNATGRILRRDLATLLGRYVQIGTTIALVGNEDAKELLVGIGQDDAEIFRGHLGRPIEVRPQQRPFDAIEGRLMGVDPRAVVVPPHEALSARHGGPLAVEARPEAAATSDSTQNGRAETRVEYQLLSPLFQGTVRISAAQSRGLAAGQLVVVRFRTDEESRARRAWRTIRHWMGQQVRDAADRS